MRIIDSYIGRAVVFGTLLALAILLPLIGFFTLADEMDEVGSGQYVWTDALVFVLLSLPSFAYQIFPISVLLGSLVGLGTLASRSELVAMRAAGVSIGRIMFAAVKAGTVMAVLAVLVGEFVAPQAEQQALQLRSEAQSGTITMKTKYGFWARDVNGYVNIREILPGANLRDIYIYEFNENRELTLATHAQSARYLDGQWILQGIVQSQVSLDGITATQLPQAGWSSFLDPTLLSVVLIEPRVLPIRSLYRYINFMHQNGQNARSYEVAFWSKLAMPLVVLVMIFLSVPTVFGSTRSTGLGQRVFLGVVIGIGFFLVSKTFSHVAVYFDVSPLLAAVSPAAIFLFFALWIFRKVN